MKRIDWVILRRLAGSTGITMAVLLGIIVLGESLDAWRFRSLSAIGGPVLAITGILLGSSRWAISTLSITLLIGAIVGLLDLQSTREMTVIKASGISVWRLLRAPLIAVLIGGALVTVGLDTVTVQLNRSLATSNWMNGAKGALWLNQQADKLHYILQAEHALPGGRQLDTVVIFGLDVPRERIEATKAVLGNKEWVLTEAVRYRSNVAPEPLATLSLPTTTTIGDMRAKLASIEDFTIFELAANLAARVSDPALHSATLTRLLRLVSLPLTLAGSLLIAFAFTAGYRRTNKYGATVLYGIVLGFVVYVLTEMASRAGDAGSIDPVFAAIGPAFVAIVIGVTVLLHKEDGRT